MSAVIDRWVADLDREILQLLASGLSPERLTHVRAVRDAVVEQNAGRLKVRVDLFRPSGKWYTEEHWTVPVDALNPADMERSPDARSIEGGPVLVPSVDPWGFPALLLRIPARRPS